MSNNRSAEKNLPQGRLSIQPQNIYFIEDLLLSVLSLSLSISRCDYKNVAFGITRGVLQFIEVGVLPSFVYHGVSGLG